MNSGNKNRRATALRVEIVALCKERQKLEGYLMRPPAMLSGTLIEQSMRCGKTSCSCHRRGGKLHGPYFYTRLKVGKRHMTRYLGGDAGRIGLAGAFREYVSKIARWRRIQREIDRRFTGLRDAQIVPWKEARRNGSRKSA